MDEQFIGEKLRSLRAANGLTQNELAQRADISYFTLAKLEQGSITNPTFKTLVSLARALSVSLDEFVEEPTGATQSASGELSEAIETVFFDIHGVLIVHWSHVFAMLGETLNREPQKIEQIFWELDDAVASGRMTIHDMETDMAQRLDVPAREVKYRDHYLRACRSNPIMQSHIENLRAAGVKVGLLSNIYPTLLDELIAKGTFEFMREDFDFIIESYAVHALKPSAAMYEAAERAANTRPEKLLLIDDTEANVVAARNRNWQGFVYEETSSINKDLTRLIGLITQGK